jgi:sporulation protein YunB
LLYKTKSQLGRKVKKNLIIAVALLILLTVLFEIQAVPFTAKCVKKQSKTISARIINRCVGKVLNKYKNVKFSGINNNLSGDVNSISTDTVSINRLKTDIMLMIQKELDKHRSYSFSLPLGSFTDITMLSTMGPPVEISFILTGSVNCGFRSSFDSGGVNQTVHHIILTVEADIVTISPEYREQTRYKTDYEVSQTVIVGNIPSTYADIVR